MVLENLTARKDSPLIIPTRTKNYVAPVNGSFGRAPQIVQPRAANFQTFGPKTPLIPTSIVGMLDQQLHNQIAQQATQAPIERVVPSIYNQTGKKS